MAEQPSHHLA